MHELTDLVFHVATIISPMAKLTKFGQMVSTLKCSILQVSISCFFLMVEFPISPGALEGKLFHPTLIQVLWPICLKKSQLISSSWLHSVNSKGTISITREREKINIRNALFWVSLVKILSVLNHVLCMSKSSNDWDTFFPRFVSEWPNGASAKINLPLV